ncbi:hypothetical protein O181_033212 [Austropuccinia psidii MF-1]|uniref:Uncharacterized protein n=1 Tax=Austropuccinia psidii MF-1 TaxID=1389203 RepID=A0A9Q3H6Y6_9BASI|nr:hypothetical protein [Austropuccinia psidii MF-1]
MKARRTRSFSDLLGDYPGIFQGPRRRLREAEDKELEDSNETEVEGAPEASEAPNLSLSNQPLGSQAEPNFLNMREKVAQLMGQLTQVVSSRYNLRALAFKTTLIKAPDSFDGKKAHKLRGFI